MLQAHRAGIIIERVNQFNKTPSGWNDTRQKSWRYRVFCILAGPDLAIGISDEENDNNVANQIKAHRAGIIVERVNQSTKPHRGEMIWRDAACKATGVFVCAQCLIRPTPYQVLQKKTNNIV